MTDAIYVPDVELVTELTIPDAPPPINPSEEAALAYLVRYRIKHTRDTHRIALRQFFQFCGTLKVDPVDAERVHIELWARSLEDVHGYKPRTMASKLNTLAGYYRLAMADGRIAKDPMSHVMRPAIPRESSTNGLTRPELADLLEQGKRSGHRDHALLCLMGLNGLRVSEVTSIDIEHLDRIEGRVELHIVHRKGGKEQYLPLEQRTAWAVEQTISGRTEGPVFLTRQGNRMDKAAVGRVVKRLCRQAGITKRITPHSLRHSFVTVARDAGVSDREIQAATGHADLRMLDYYDRRDRRDLAHGATSSVAAFIGRAR